LGDENYCRVVLGVMNEIEIEERVTFNGREGNGLSRSDTDVTTGSRPPLPRAPCSAIRLVFFPRLDRRYRVGRVRCCVTLFMIPVLICQYHREREMNDEKMRD
jgi:hypothetical protein